VTEPGPAYQQIMAALRQSIERGELPTGARVPSERALARDHGVSRMTARHALDTLSRDGIIMRVPGSGSFVSSRKVEHSVSELIGFSDEMRRSHLDPTSRVLSVTQVAASATLSQKLQIPIGTLCHRVERLRFADGEAMSHEVAWVVVDRAPDLADLDLSGSLYRMLATHYGIHLAGASQRIEAIACDAATAGLLDVPVSSPLLRLERMTFDEASIPVELVIAQYRGDKYVLLSRLQVKEDAWSMSLS
jgi:GntR family transcriptional regulator